MLRRAVAAGRIVVYETRGSVECRELLAGSPASFVALELTAANLDGVLETVREIADRCSAARVMVLAERGAEKYEWLLREAGVVDFVVSWRRLAPQGEMIARHLADVADKPGPRQQIWDRLPWGPTPAETNASN